jgi:hypothetical protein
MILKGKTLASEHGRRTLTGLRCEYRWEAPVRPEPGAQAAAAGLRASRADRERVIDLLKAAFVQGRLDRDEFGARIGQALTSRTYGELAAVTADIPAELIGALPHRPPVRARRRIPFNTAVTGAACMAGLVNMGAMAALLSRSPVAVVLFVAFTVIGTIVAIGAMIVAPRPVAASPGRPGAAAATTPGRGRRSIPRDGTGARPFGLGVSGGLAVAGVGAAAAPVGLR